MPDPNSLPPSRRVSASLPIGSINVLPSNQLAVAATSSSVLASPASPGAVATASPFGLPSDVGVGPGPGPLRHPRPMTAAELHQQLEKEQEAVINRLSRELSLLRAAHNASVASNSSSASTGAPAADPQDGHLLSGAAYMGPSSRRHHRSPSNASIRSTAAIPSALSGLSPSQPPMARTPSMVSMSRHSSSASWWSLASSPVAAASMAPPVTSASVALAGSNNADCTLTLMQQQRLPRPTGAAAMLSSSTIATVGSSTSTLVSGSSELQQPLSPGMLPATTRYEETAFHRSELDVTKRENEALRRRVRELERLVRDRRASDAGRPRSESISTTTSASIAGNYGGSGGAEAAGFGVARPRDRAVERERDRTSTSRSSSGLLMEEVKFGESAASAGL